MNRNGELGALGIAFIYVGTLVGAGFASGREIWQFFGVFGDAGRISIWFVGIIFLLMSLIATSISRVLRTSDLGKIVFPFENRYLSEMVSYFMAAMLFTSLIFMSAAGGSLFSQQFGINKIIGGLIVVVLTVATVIGGISRIGNVFKKIIPFLIIAMVGVSIAVLISDLPPGDVQVPIEPSPAADTPVFAILLYTSYNMLALIPIVASTATTATRKVSVALKGAALGGILLGALAILLTNAMLTDSGYSHAMDMPMLALANKIGKITGVIYTCVMMFAIYASASGNFYGFTRKIKDDKRKNLKIVLSALLAFALSLVGFKNLVAYLLPIQGMLGAIIVVFTIINFFKVVVCNFVTNQEKEKYNFPEGVKNVTTGRGAASLLIEGSEKTALMDCSMAYCGEELVEKIKHVLGDKKLDYFFVSHTHYDHIGALPYLRKAWPDLIVFGAQHGQDVLKRDGAIRGIKKLGDEAARMYSGGKVKEIITEGLSIDRVVHEGDRISLGNQEVVVLETPGHTKCSMTYVVEPMSMMLAAESVGVMERKGMCHPAILSSFEDAIESIHKCRDYGAKTVVISHYGCIPEKYAPEMWRLLEKEARTEKSEIEEGWAAGLSEDEIVQMMTDKYWYKGRAEEQPMEAFEINMRCTVNLYRPDK